VIGAVLFLVAFRMTREKDPGSRTAGPPSPVL